MDRRKLLKYGALGTVAAAAGTALQPALAESDAAHPAGNRASTSGKTEIERIAAMTSFIPGVAPEKGGLEIYPGQDIPPLKHQVFRDAGMVIERDIAVTMRDGVKIYIDLYRPESMENGKVPVIIGWSPYGKFINGLISYARGKVKYSAGQVSKYSNYEFFDPVNWCRRGHA